MYRIYFGAIGNSEKRLPGKSASKSTVQVGEICQWKWDCRGLVIWKRRLVCLSYMLWKMLVFFYRLAESVDSTVGRFNLHGIVLWECVRLFLAFCTSVNKWMYYLLWLVCRVSHLCMNIARFCVSHDHQCTRCTRPTNWHSYVVAKSSCLLYAFELQNCREKPKKNTS